MGRAWFGVLIVFEAKISTFVPVHCNVSHSTELICEATIFLVVSMAILLSASLLE